VKWLTRLFGKLKSLVAGESPAAKPAAPAEEAVAPTKSESAAPAAPTAPVEPAAPAEPVEPNETVETIAPAEPAEPAAVVEPEDEAPADPAINVLDSEREAAKLSEAPAESPVVELVPEPVAEPVAEPAPVVEETPAAAPAAEEGPFGPGSAKPLADGSAPGAEYTVKGKRSSKLFHTAESPYFGRTKADVWFKTPADAESAGFAAWNHKKKAPAK
jgi:hypothetical protein